ncbi:MAG: tetratricopeptide repeat protein [Gemmatimonadota bacterium]
MDHPDRLDRRMLLFVAAAAMLVYANSLWNGFAYDDVFIIQMNTRVHQLSDLGQIWLTPYWPSFGSELGLYRPLTIFFFALEWAIGGGAPWIFHLVNVLLHALASILVFLLIERLFNARAAIAGALLFALHPVHTEAVANIVGQGELLATVGVLAACLIHVRRPDGVAIDTRRRILLFTLYGLALLAKESAVVLPGLLVLLDFAQRRVALNRSGIKRYANAIAFPIAMFCAILGAFLLLRYSVLSNVTGTDAAPGLPHLREQYRLLNAFRAWPEFVRLLFVPVDLVVDYGPGVIFPVASVTPMVGLGMLLVFGTAALFLATPHWPRAGLPAGWFLLTILPVSNFLFPIGVLIAERTLYLPSVAVCFLAGYAWAAARSSAARETRRLAVAIAIAIAIGFSARTVSRNPVWDSLPAVWKGLLRDHPEAYRSQWVNALSMWKQGRVELAEKYFQLTERIWPRDSQFLSDFGNFYIGQKRYDKAIEYLERSRAMTPFVPRTHEFLAYAYLYAGRPKDALVSALHANAMEGSHKSLTYAIVGGAYDQLERYDEAAGAWRAAAKSKTGNLWLTHAMLARSLARAGRTDAALAAADVAYSKTLGQPSLETVVRKLQVAIRSGCYPAGQDCDPLAGWAITVASSRPTAGI